MNWQDVGDWLKGNMDGAAGLVGALLKGNVPEAVASGISLVVTATGKDDPLQALGALKADGRARPRLAELAYEQEEEIRAHLRTMAQLELEAHQETQETIRSGDRAEDRLVRWTRPGQSWVSLMAAVAYIFSSDTPDMYVLGALLALPCSYAGLRQIGKGLDALASHRRQK